ncbi:unnamed protein product, partial [Phaeothamnion confervicola]
MAYDLSTYADSYARDSYAREFSQVSQSTGIDPLEISHSFYGISLDGERFELARITATETAVDSRIGKLNFQIIDSSGNATTVLNLSDGGVHIGGDINVLGGSTTFSTSTIEVEDINVVLANTATALSHLDGGGIILGTTASGTKNILYDTSDDRWNINGSLNLDAGESFSIGGDDVILDSTGLYFGGVAISAGSLTLSPDVVLDSEGLTIGSIRLYPATGLTIGDSISVNTDGLSLGTVTIDDTGLTVGTSLSLTVADGLVVGDDVVINSSGLQL